MKLRCERDVLVEALTTAGRAVSSRGGATQVLSGIRLEVAGDRLHVAGSDLDLTIEVDLTAAGGEDGACVLPARLVADIVRALEPGAVTLEIVAFSRPGAAHSSANCSGSGPYRTMRGFT